MIRIRIRTWLQTLWDQGGSTSYLSWIATANPSRRKLRRLTCQNLTGEQSMTSRAALTDGQRTIFEEQLDVDFASRGVTRLVSRPASSPLAGRPHWPTSHSTRFPVLKNLACLRAIGCPSSRRLRPGRATVRKVNDLARSSIQS